MPGHRGCGPLARAADPTLVEAVYAQMRGPSVQTVAETAMLRTLGADLVGMSTVVEAIAARAAGLELLGLSAVTTLEGTGAGARPGRRRRGSPRRQRGASRG